MARSFKHSGDAGDIIASLPAVKLLGGGDYFLSRSTATRVPTSEETLRNIGPLLESQPYLRKVALYAGQAVAFDLDRFRSTGLITDNLASRHLISLGLPERVMDQPWLRVDPTPVAPVVINRVARWQNPHFPWDKIMAAYHNKAVFVGTKGEWRAFSTAYGSIPHHPTSDLLALARVIAGCKLFIGSQSAAFWIAEGMKITLIQETSLLYPNCRFNRPNAQCVAGERLTLPPI